jgi:hypothetical protein
LLCKRNNSGLTGVQFDCFFRKKGSTLDSKLPGLFVPGDIDKSARGTTPAHSAIQLNGKNMMSSTHLVFGLFSPPPAALAQTGSPPEQ